MSLIGLDIGTSGCKAIAFRADGAILAGASREYPILTPRPGWAEQDAELVWRLACECLGTVAKACADDPPRAMAISAQGEAVMPVDANGRPMRQVILGMDTRSVAENEHIRELWGDEGIFARTGMPIHTINTLPKLYWLRDHESSLWRDADRFLLYEDYVIGRLCGRPVTSHCLASRTQMYATQQGSWGEEILSDLGLEPQRLADLAPDGIEPVGTLLPEISEALGLSADMPVMAGGHDQACAALGSGVISPGLAMVSTGTAEVVELALDEPLLAPALAAAGISVYRHVAPGRYLAMTLNHAGGLALRWFRDALCAAERDQAPAEGTDAYDRILAGAPEGPTSLLFLPHLAGSGTPTLDTASKGAWLGLTLSTTRAEMAKALIEGLTFELRQNLALLQKAGYEIASLHAVGGGAKSDLWLQCKADICGIPLRVPAVTEAACLGAALLAGVGAGVYADLDEAVGATVTLDRRIEPDPGMRVAYAERAALYDQVYPALGDLLHAL